MKKKQNYCIFSLAVVVGGMFLGSLLMQSAQAAESASTETMRVSKNIAYNKEAGVAGTGDLYLPANPKGAKVILLIHGGAWNSLDRHRMEGIVKFLLGQKYAVFNIDYRLLPQAPYPAGEEDCIFAAKYLIESTDSSMQALNRDKITIVGASSGGHLALMTGLKLPRERVAGIIDISGPTDLTAPEIQGLIQSSGFTRGHKNPGELLCSASPTKLVGIKPPPLLIIHDCNDSIVNIRQADRLLQAWREKGGSIQSFFFDGMPSGHDIWRVGGKANEAPLLHPKIEWQMEAFLRTFHPID